MANEGHIVEKHGPAGTGGKEGLTIIRERLDQWQGDLTNLDTAVKEFRAQHGTLTEEVTELKRASAQSQATLNEVLEHVKAQDKRLAPGSKIYHPMDGRKPQDDPRRREFAKFMLDLAHYRMTGDANGPHKSEHWKRAQSEGVQADGGYLVHPEQLSMVTELQEEYGLARRLCRQIRMRKNEIRVPTLSSRPTVYWPDEGNYPPNVTPPAYGVGGGTALTQSKATFDRPAITAKRMCAIDALTWEVEEDAEPMLSDYLPDLFALQFTKEEDFQAFAAPTSGNPFTGLLYASGVQEFEMAATKTNFTDLGYDDILKLIEAVSPFAHRNAAFIFSTSMGLHLRSIKGSDGHPLWTEMARSNPQTIFGFPFYRSEIMPAQDNGGDPTAGVPFMLFGDFLFHGMGIRNDFRVDFSNEQLFVEAKTVMRCMQRVGFKPLIGAAIGRIKAADS